MTDPAAAQPTAVGPRLVLDAAACEGHGICVLCCPERIALDAWGFPKLDAAPLTSPRDLARARRAVAACPEGALELEGLGAETAQAGGTRPGRPRRAAGAGTPGKVSHGTGDERGWRR